jgi:rfaE bifunctional protein kinase chain/domain
MLDSAALARLTRGFSEARVLVVGDLIADEFLFGEVGRISREAPVLILYHRETNVVPGGAANAAANMASLGAQVKAIGLIGYDPSGEALTKALQNRGIDTSGLVIDPDRPTTTKTRITAGSLQTVTQQIVRIDRESREPAGPEVEARVLKALEERIPEVDIVLVSEYGNGLITDRLIARTMALCLQHDKRVIVDAQCDLRKFRGATAVTPNQPEAEAFVGFPITDDESLRKAGEVLLAETGVEFALITRGSNGIALFESGEDMRIIPAFNRTEVFDVTGAGDTVVGTLTLALASGATPTQATLLANLAASIVIRRFGTATTTVVELEETFQKQGAQPLMAQS